ncbi:MAG: AMP-binding protein [Actinomycetota bacterium]|jgi:carnitine-CoA ligase
MRDKQVRRSVPEVLAQRAADQPGKLLVSCGGVDRTYGEMAAVAEHRAGALAALGVGVGDRVALLTANRIEMVELFFACARLGAVQVPINTFLKGEFLRYQLADCGAETVVVDAPGLAAVTPLLDRLPAVRRIIALDEADGEVVPYQELVAEPGRDLAVPRPDDLASIIYTSGTTGLPKGCMITQGYFVHIGNAWRGACDLSPDDVVFTAFPFFHLSGQALALMACLTGGLSLFLEPAFSATAFMPRAREVGATVTMGVGAMALAVLATPLTPEDHDHRIRYSMWIPLPPAKQLELEERFGAPVNAEGFGQTECAPVTFNRLSGQRRRETAGLPAPWLDVRIVDDDDVEVPRGEVGEIVVRPLEPDSLFSGYWGRPEETLQTFRNLWHHTGDYGRMDEEGFVSFVDRKKDALRRRGENVSSMELEQAILRHPKVAEVAVHAVPSAATEDDIKACIVLIPEAATTPEELFAHFEKELPYFAVPRYVELLPALPKNAIGRVLKHELRDSGVTPATWDLEALGLTVARDARR